MRECYIHVIRSINLINNEEKAIWVIPKNIEAVEKWGPKREELENEIKENKTKYFYES